MRTSQHLLFAAILTAAWLPLPVLAIEAGNQNPPKDGGGVYLYPPDNPDTPYDPATQTGRLDTLGLASPFSGVGSINGGTGTLIDPTHVLTAAHLFGQGFSNTGATFVVDTGNGKTMSFKSSAVSIPKQFQGVGSSDLYDLAIVTLSTPVTSVLPGIKTYGLYTDPLVSGTTLTLVGYGRTGDGVNGYAGTTTNKNSYPGGRRVGENAADGTLLSDGNYTDGYQSGSSTYLFDFDSPDGSAPNILGGGSLGNTVETDIGTGDSGGPAFVLVNGQYEIAALNNFTFDLNTNTDHSHPTSGFFGSGGGGAVISAYTNFIHGVDPAVAPEPGPLTALGLGGLLLAGSVWRKRRRAGTSA